MITTVKLPSGHLGLFPEVKYDTELKGEHHEMLLSAPEQLFERTMASVVGSLMQTGDVYKLSFPDLLYLFFITRAASIGVTYRAKWKCAHTVKQGGIEQECGTENDFILDLGKVAKKFVAQSFEYPRYDITVHTVIDEAEVDIKTKVFVRFLTVSEEFDALDDLSDRGISRDTLKVPANAYAYSKLRILRALSFEDQRVNGLTMDQKDEVLKSLSFVNAQKLFNDLKELDLYGVDLGPRKVACSKCKHESKLSIPISGSFFLS